MGGGSGSSGPTLQQQQLETQQAITTANLNLEENAQRKSILNAMQGTRVFRGSALSRAVAGNTSGSNQPPGAPSLAQTSAGQQPAPISAASQSLLDQRSSSELGATPAGGVGASASQAAASAVGRGGNVSRY